MSSTTTLVEYESAHPLLSENAQKLQDTLHTHFTTNPSINNSFKSGLQEATKKVLENIRGLTKAIREIKYAFGVVGVELDLFDKTTGAYDATTALGPRWEAFGKRFDDLLDLSHKNAAAARAVLQIHNEALFPEGGAIDPSMYEDIKTEVQELIVEIGRDEEQALHIEQGFTTLAKDIREFEIDIENALYTRSDNAVEGLQAARKDMAILRVRLSQVKREMTDVGLACVACLSAGAISAAFLFFTLSPAAAHVLVTSVIASIPPAIEFYKKDKERKQLKSDIEGCKKRIAELSKQYDLLQKYQAALEQTKSDIEDISTKIDTIAGIWHYLRSDLQLLHANLTKAAGGKITGLFARKIDISRALYGELSILLEEYVKGVEGQVSETGGA